MKRKLPCEWTGVPSDGEANLYILIVKSSALKSILGIKEIGIERLF